MFTQVSETDFIDAFKALRPENFSYQGLQALFAYLEESEADTGTPLEISIADTVLKVIDENPKLNK